MAYFKGLSHIISVYSWRDWENHKHSEYNLQIIEVWIFRKPPCLLNVVLRQPHYFHTRHILYVHVIFGTFSAEKA
jgi:hypothetical protein